jgi:hypothetical protein
MKRNGYWDIFKTKSHSEIFRKEATYVPLPIVKVWNIWVWVITFSKKFQAKKKPSLLSIYIVMEVLVSCTENQNKNTEVLYESGHFNDKKKYFWRINFSAGLPESKFVSTNYVLLFSSEDRLLAFLKFFEFFTFSVIFIFYLDFQEKRKLP